MEGSTVSFTIVGPVLNAAAVAEPILRALPDWFGIEEAIVENRLEVSRVVIGSCRPEQSARFIVKWQGFTALQGDSCPQRNQALFQTALTNVPDQRRRQKGRMYFITMSLCQPNPNTSNVICATLL